MKMFRSGVLLLATVLVGGCHVSHPQASAPAPAPTAAPPPIVTPGNALTARVLSYNATGRFVVLGFPVGQMPRQEQTLFLYRNGMKVGEVKINGPQQDNNIVADLVAGEVQVGDEVRDQ